MHFFPSTGRRHLRRLMGNKWLVLGIQRGRNTVGRIARVANYVFYQYDCHMKVDTTALHLAHKNESTMILNLGLSGMAMDARTWHLAQILLNPSRNEMTRSLAGPCDMPT